MDPASQTGPFRMNAKLILASKSASRRLLMSGAGLRYDAVAAEID